VASSFVYTSFLEYATSQVKDGGRQLNLHELVRKAINKLMQETRLLRSKRTLFDIAESLLSVSRAYELRDMKTLAFGAAQIEESLSNEDISRLDSDQQPELATLLLYFHAMMRRIRRRVLLHAPAISTPRLRTSYNSIFAELVAQLKPDGRSSVKKLTIESCRYTLSTHSAAGLLLSYSVADVKLDDSSWDSHLLSLRSQSATRVLHTLDSVSRTDIKTEFVSLIESRYNSSLFIPLNKAQVAKWLDTDTIGFSEIGFLLYMELLAIIFASYPLWFSKDEFSAFNDAAKPRLMRIANACEFLSCDMLMQIVKAIDISWPQHEELKFLSIVLITHSMGKDLVLKQPEQIAIDLRRIYGRDASLISRRLSETFIAAECSELINSLPHAASLANYFIQRMALESGFIPSLGNWIDDGDIDNAIPLHAEIDTSVHGYSPKGATKGWIQHRDSYAKLRTSSDWPAIDKHIGNQAALICQRLLSGERIVIADFLEENWFNDPRRVLVARRVFVGYAKHEQDYVLRMFQMGWLTTTEFREIHLVDRTAFRQYCWQLGLPSRALKEPLRSDALLPEEQRWLDSFTFP